MPVTHVHVIYAECQVRATEVQCQRCFKSWGILKEDELKPDLEGMAKG